MNIFLWVFLHGAQWPEHWAWQETEQCARRFHHQFALTNLSSLLSQMRYTQTGASTIHRLPRWTSSNSTGVHHCLPNPTHFTKNMEIPCLTTEGSIAKVSPRRHRPLLYPAIPANPLHSRRLGDCHQSPRLLEGCRTDTSWPSMAAFSTWPYTHSLPLASLTDIDADIVIVVVIPLAEEKINLFCAHFASCTLHNMSA